MDQLRLDVVHIQSLLVIIGPPLIHGQPIVDTGLATVVLPIDFPERLSIQLSAPPLRIGEIHGGTQAMLIASSSRCYQVSCD